MTDEPKEEEELVVSMGEKFFNALLRFGALPRATREALWRRHASKLAFPAGLPLNELRPNRRPSRHGR
jgi:hypothetical protein